MKIRVWTNNQKIWTNDGYVQYEAPGIQTRLEEDRTLWINLFDEDLNQIDYAIYNRDSWDAVEQVKPPTAEMLAKTKQQPLHS